MEFSTEIKRKVFHHLSVVYMLIYALFPRWASLSLLFTVLIALAAVEFVRIRRPELNAWFLKKFGGLHRPSEILAPSGIFFTLLGCWVTMFIFTNRRIVLPALGFMAFGDTVAALAGQKWGQRLWKMNPSKTQEGSAAMALVSAIWALFFVRWPVAILGGLSAAWVEARKLPWNDNFWVPVLSGLFLSLFNLVLGRH